MKSIVGPDPRRRDVAYRLLNGFLELEMGEVPPSKERIQIDSLVARIYQHRIKLCTHADLDFEDEDLNEIVSIYEQLNRLCAELMYNQGWYDAKQAAQL